MEKIKKLFIDIDKKDLKIMKSGLILSFIISIIGAILLSYNLISLHSIFLYNIGLSIVKLGCYFAVEFIVCGILVDNIATKKE